MRNLNNMENGINNDKMSDRIFNLDKIAYGGDYNPEQWPEEVWHKDMEMFKAAGIDTLTLNVFSWASLQPEETVYDFERLDKIIDLVTENDMNIVLATSTAVHPAWMARKYPEVLRVDFQGRKRKFGGRHNSCPNSGAYRSFSAKIAEKLSERYGKRKNLLAWHISNEYGGECYCENCEKAFRVWLKNKYETMERLNSAWNTSFWGHTFYDWNEIVLPNLLTEHFEAYGRDRTMFQPITIDYRRFNSDGMLDCYRLEYEAVRKHSAAPVTTNLMGFYMALDYQKWAKYMDFVSWDNYPSPGDSAALTAMCHDLMRGVGDQKPFCLMEQTPSVTNWQPYNKLKRPGVMRLWSYQAVAHGSDTVMFFQMRRSIGACEKFHGAVIDHADTMETRVFREISSLGAELRGLGDLTLGSRVKAEAAIIFDWDNWWGTEYTAGPSIRINYRDEVLRYYEAFHKNNISCDIISYDSDISGYKIVVAPVLYMVKDGFKESIEKYVQSGGTFVTTYFSGYVNETDLIYGAYPGPLSKVLGIWVEESDALLEGERNGFTIKGKTYDAEILCDIIHEKGAEVIARYEEDFYAGVPVMTKNSYGEGAAYYVGCSSNEEFYLDFVSSLVENTGISRTYRTYNGVEFVRREKTEKINEEEIYTTGYVFVLNHNEFAVDLMIEKDCVDIITNIAYNKDQVVTLNMRDVMILKEADDKSTK